MVKIRTRIKRALFNLREIYYSRVLGVPRIYFIYNNDLSMFDKLCDTKYLEVYK